MTDQTGVPAGQATGSTERHQNGVTPELVEEIAAKVYAMLLRDLKIEQERHRWLVKKSLFRGV
jgi:hypothetical protein